MNEAPKLEFIYAPYIPLYTINWGDAETLWTYRLLGAFELGNEKIKIFF